jgi:hypothetical protein
MYWPIGAPRIYAASSSKATGNHIIESDDDAESRETTEGSGSLLEAPSTVSEDRSDDGLPGRSGRSTPMSPGTPGVKPIEQQELQSAIPTRTPRPDISISDAAASAQKETLLGLRVSRTGHLFAVISPTSLTIWQTKVCIPSYGHKSANVLAHCHISSGHKVQQISHVLWIKRWSSRTTRFRYLRRSNNTGLSHYIFLGYRPRRSSI